MTIIFINKRLGICLSIAASVMLMAACSTPDNETRATSSSASADRLAVAANFYPVEWLVREIGGDRIDVTVLTPVGEEPHDLVLTAKSRQAIDDSDVVFYLGSGFQPDIEKVVVANSSPTTAVDLLDAPGVTLLEAPFDLGKESLSGNKDPHVWLDPTLMAAMARQVAASLVQADPANSVVYEGNLEVVLQRLDDLQTSLVSRLSDCVQTTIVTSHAAFNYLAQRYGLTQLAITGVSPDQQPDPATLEKIAGDAKAAGVTTVFFEDQLPRDLSETVAKEIGAKVDLLSALEFDPAVTIAPGQDYVSVMSDNGERLSAGLQCR